MWVVLIALTWHFRNLYLYSSPWAWLPAGVLFFLGTYVYLRAGSGFSFKQLGGVPELYPQSGSQRLITAGIRRRVRHPLYLAHFLEMLAWSLGSGLVVCFGLTAFALVTGGLMIRAEDAELERRFGAAFQEYRARVPGVIPRMRNV